ncbi:MAG: class I SAM-dependent methyltransferase, partial [Candidatus Eisenbacteria bacterium]|nr:class I SAM-dependent methyltransferase [Candidatus Eisenbacteria bacterium]
LDVGCGTGFWVERYLRRGAEVTGIDIAPTAIARLRDRFPEARFMLADVGEAPIEGSYAIVNAFDVLYHITDDARWDRALAHLAAAVEPGGLLLVTDTFVGADDEADHNRMRPLAAYRRVLGAAGFTVADLRPTHVLLNRPLGAFRFLNRAPALLLAVDRALLAAGLHGGVARRTNTLMVARRSDTGSAPVRLG